MPESGNALVTELLLKSAYYCPLRTVQSYANRSVSSSLSVSLQQLRFFFIFFDKLQVNWALIQSQLSINKKLSGVFIFTNQLF